MSNNTFTVIMECEQIDNSENCDTLGFYCNRPFKEEYRLYLDEDQASSAWDVFSAFKRIFLALGFTESTWDKFVNEEFA